MLAANGTRVTTMLKANCRLPRLQISGYGKLQHQHRHPVKVSGKSAMEADTRVVQLTDSNCTGTKTEQHRCNANKTVISYTSANVEESENHSDILCALLIIVILISGEFLLCIPLIPL